MIEGEMLKLTVEEFSRIQDYMLSCEKDSEANNRLYKYHENRV